MTAKTIKQEARAFLLWREGTAVDWDCSTKELADATGVEYTEVLRICEARKWPITDGRQTGRSRKYGSYNRNQGAVAPLTDVFSFAA